MTSAALDSVLTRLGICGFFPLGIYFLAWLPALPQTFSLMAAAYSTIIPGFRCPNITGGGGGGGGRGVAANDSAAGNGGRAEADADAAAPSTLMPFARTIQQMKEACARGCNTSWEFEDSKDSSIVAEYGLVCEK